MTEPAVSEDDPADAGMKRMCVASGEVTDERRLVSFLYVLLRDDLPSGRVEELVDRVCSSPGETLFTNGWLATYAKDIAARLLEEGPW